MDTQPKIKVFVAVPCYGQLPAEFAKSLLRLLFERPCDLVVRILAGDSLVCRARNTLTAEFLESDCTHLLFLDSDLVFSPNDVRRLIEHGKDIVSGFYPKKQDGKLEWVCNAALHETQPDEVGLQEVRYMGTGFMLIARSVFERMIDAYGYDIEFRPDNAPELAEWDFWRVGVYRFADGTARYLSEDWYFCQLCLDRGISVWADTRVIVKHVGHAVYPLQHQMETLRVVEAIKEAA